MNGKDKSHVLIVGGSGGIGAACAERFLEAGWRVTATYHSKTPKHIDDRITFVACNLLAEESVSALFLSQRRKGVDVILNASARPLTLGSFATLPWSAFDDDHAFYVGGAVRLMRHAFSHFKEFGVGTLIHMLSTAIDERPQYMAPYVIAKEGVASLVRMYGPEWQRSGSRLLGLSPGFVETDLLKNFPPKLLELERMKAGGAFLMPAEIASIALRMAEPESRLKSGAIVTVNGRGELDLIEERLRTPVE
jgi:NAD(P)-dependent dehydrogenase (short-subunit alcohol dehydrogenase family)